jgi:hypothetical protein
MPRVGIALMIVLGAGLFWWLQPLGAEHLLAQYGGGAEVWTACLCFFQLTLLGGYLYAHALGRWVAPAAALRIHGALALLAAMTFHHPSVASPELTDGTLTWRILVQLTRDLGPAATVLAATSPLLQLAYHRRTHRAPWRLYALANLASLILLLSHPWVLEPYLSSDTQGALWRGLLGCYGLAGFVVAARPMATQQPLSPMSPTQVSTTTRGWLWALLAGAASALLMATTEALARDMASSPLLWVAPLAVFLASIIITFDRPQLYRRGPIMSAMGLAMIALAAAASFAEAVPFMLGAGAHLAVLAAGATLCHGELYHARPEPSELTRYHLSMAFGGAVGGIAVAIGAPALFVRMVELPVSILLVCVTVALAASRHDAGQRLMRRAALGLVAVALISGLLGLGALQGALAHDQTVVLRSRNAYGTLTLIKRQLPETTMLMLVDGNTTHGEAHLDGPHVGTPTLYYAPTTGIGEVFEALQDRPQPLNIGVIGMGVGTLAAYGRTGDTLTFYELNPAVVRIAREHFTFLSKSLATSSVQIGDGRALLRAEPADQRFDLLVIDAFSSDAIPAHLLTTEAMALYRERIGPQGRIAFHVTNRHLNLAPIVETLAASAGLGAQVVHTEGVATWVIVAADLPLRLTGHIDAPWTDDYAPVWRALP